MVKGELPERQIEKLKEVGIKIQYFDDLFYENTKDEKYGRNFIKVRAWAMIKYDTILVLDADLVAIQDVYHMFQMPVQFAMAIAHSEEVVEDHLEIQVNNGNGGVLLIHPCMAIHDHMIELLDKYPALRFTDGMAEQEFFNW
jgi:hypothetical protein